jgi:hypothetical protein
VTVPEGQKIEPNTALLEAALPIIHKHKIAPEAFHDLARAVTGYELQKFQAATAEFTEDRKKLGTNAATRSTDVNNRMKAAIGDKWMMDASAMTAAGVEMFEAIAARLSSQNNVVPLNQNRDAGPTPEPDKPLIDRLADTMYGPKKAS